MRNYKDLHVWEKAHQLTLAELEPKAAASQAPAAPA